MEIVIRAAIVYGLVWLLLRGMGKRELAEVTVFELVILVVLGDIVQQGVTQEDMSLTGSMLAISTMALLAVFTSVASQRLRRLRPVLEGRPSVIVRDGEVVMEAVRALRMTVDEIHEAARKRGDRAITNYAWVIVEADGEFSFIDMDDQERKESQAGDEVTAGRGGEGRGGSGEESDS